MLVLPDQGEPVLAVGGGRRLVYSQHLDWDKVLFGCVEEREKC